MNADLVAFYNSLMATDADKRCVATAITNVQQAGFWAVHAITNPPVAQAPKPVGN